jgi:N-formylglutamate amidohydrolase
MSLSKTERELLGQLFRTTPPIEPDRVEPALVAFEFLAGPSGVTQPLLVHVPHSATRIPRQVRDTFVLDDEALAAELLAMTDHHTDALFGAATELGGAVFVNRLSRLVMDPERFPSDAEEPMAAKGLGAIYRRTSTGALLRPPTFDEADRAALMTRYQAPYAAAFEEAVTAMLDHFGWCFIVDGHSFPRSPLPWEDPSLSRPDFCLGHEPFHVHPFLQGAVDGLEEQGFTVAHNEPFAGSYVPLRHYGTDPRVRSTMIEVRRDLYMDESTGERSSDFGRIQAVIADLLDDLAP